MYVCVEPFEGRGAGTRVGGLVGEVRWDRVLPLHCGMPVELKIGIGEVTL